MNPFCNCISRLQRDDFEFDFGVYIRIVIHFVETKTEQIQEFLLISCIVRFCARFSVVISGHRSRHAC